MKRTPRSVMLTKKQNKFAHMLVKSATKTLAYKKTYATSKMSSKTINKAASRLSKNPKVIARLKELRIKKKAVELMLRLSYGELVINELQNIAVNSRSGRVRIKALELLGKTVGLFNCG